MKQMYFLGFSIEDIYHALNTNVETVRFYVFGFDGSGTDPRSWYFQKKEVDKTGLMPYIKNKVDALEKTTSMAYGLLTKALGNVADRVEDGGHQFTVDEVKKLADVVGALDKITRLETGKPTDINETLHITLKEAQEILRRDPFLMAEFEDVTVKEVPLDEVEFKHSPFEGRGQ